MRNDSETDMQRAYDELTEWWHSLDADSRDILLDRFSVGFAYHSNKIEDDRITYHDTEEIFDKNGVSSYTGNLRTLFEISNQKSAWTWARERGATPFTSETITSAHRILTYGTYDADRWAKGERPGCFKRGDYVVGINDVGYHAQDVPAAVDELASQIQEELASRDAQRYALTIAAFLHAQLVEIHPFADGNGRTARLLSNMVLMTLGHPPLTVHEENRLAYFGALDAFHDAAELAPLEEFFMIETLTTWHGGQHSEKI